MAKKMTLFTIDATNPSDIQIQGIKSRSYNIKREYTDDIYGKIYELEDGTKMNQDNWNNLEDFDCVGKIFQNRHCNEHTYIVYLPLNYDSKCARKQILKLFYEYINPLASHYLQLKNTLEKELTNINT